MGEFIMLSSKTRGNSCFIHEVRFSAGTLNQRVCPGKESPSERFENHYIPVPAPFLYGTALGETGAKVRLEECRCAANDWRSGGAFAVKVPNLLRGRNALWNSAIVGSTVVALGVNLAGLLTGITIIIPHLLYIPVVISAYRYPKRGLILAGCISGAYALMVVAVVGMASLTVAEALIRAMVVIIIGELVALLTLRLRTQERLYQGLFDNSEAGSILIRNEGGTWKVEEANWNAAALLKRDPADLRGQPLTTFWSRQEGEDILSLFSRQGRVYAVETTLSAADGDEQRVLISIARIPENQAVLTFVDITRRVAAEQALKNARDKLHLLSRISGDHLHRTVKEMIEILDAPGAESMAAAPAGVLPRIRALAGTLARHLSLTETYQELGTRPPQWIPVQKALESLEPAGKKGEVSLRFWVERLEVYADPLFRDVLGHVVGNAFRHGGSLQNILVTYQRMDGGLTLMIEDDGAGIPAAMKDTIFEYDSGGHGGLGLFICRQILGVTGMTMTEIGTEGAGARFAIHIPEGNFRIEGVGDAPPFPAGEAGRGARLSGDVTVRELTSAEFTVADALWVDYHSTTGNPASDRIFAAFINGNAVSLARCRRHPDGLEVDGIFTPERHRGHGYANAAVQGLVEACGHDPLYMHFLRNLTGFYARYGFVAIPEGALPPTIRERFAWAQGEMEQANVAPMMREPT